MREILKVYGTIILSLAAMLVFALLLLLTTFYLLPNSTTFRVMEWIFAVAANMAAIVFTIAILGLIYVTWQRLKIQMHARGQMLDIPSPTEAHDEELLEIFFGNQ